MATTSSVKFMAVLPEEEQGDHLLLPAKSALLHRPMAILPEKAKLFNVALEKRAFRRQARSWLC
jgi:hypothetical protein